MQENGVLLLSLKILLVNIIFDDSPSALFWEDWELGYMEEPSHE